VPRSLCNGRRVVAILTLSVTCASGPTIGMQVWNAGPVLASSQYATAVLADSPAAYWRLGETSGTTAADSSGNGYPGTISGSVTLGASGAILGDPDTAMSFSGGYINTSYVQTSVTAYSEEAWMRSTSTAPFAPVFTDRGVDGSGHSLSMYFGETGGASGGPGLVSFELDTNSQEVGVTAAQAINDGQWHHVVGTWSAPSGMTVDPSQFTVYIDGAPVATTPASHNYCGCGLPTSPLSGEGGLTEGYNYIGTLDELAIYPTALTPAQVAAHFAASGRQAPPIGGAENPTETNGGSNPSERWLGATHGCTCKPVDTNTGNFWHTFEDLDVPGRGPALNVTRTYNSSMAAANGPFGYGWQFSYGASLSASGSTATITQENGSQTTFTLSDGTYTAPPRVIASLVHNGDGTYTLTRQARQRLTFSSGGQLLSIADLNGATTSLTYSGGQLSTITDPAGRAVSLNWTGAHIAAVTDANVSPARVVQYAYDASGNLSDVTDVAGGNEHFTYDADHLLLTMRDPRGNTVTNHYDASSRVDWQTDELNRKTTFAYAFASTTITDPQGNVTVDGYTNGLRTSVTKGYGTPQAATWTFLYDRATLGLISVTDPDGHTSTATYDATGNRLTATDALGRQTINAYDALNDLTSTQDPKGIITTLTYDASGNLTETSTPLVGSSPAVSQTTVYAHGDAVHPGDVTAITDADGKISHFTYDAAGDLASSTDPLGDTATYTDNEDGWLLTSTSPKGNVAGCGCAATYTTSYGHNAFGQVTTVTDPLGHLTTKHYDANRNLDQFTDADGNLTTYVHDASNELTAVQRADSPQTSLVTDYNADGTVLDQKDGAGNTTTYGYDALGRVTSTTTPATTACPSGCTTTLAYDGAGNRLTSVDPAGGTTTYTYDAANQLTGITYSDGVTPNVSGITYSDGVTPNVSGITYDADGQRTAMTDGTGTSSWSYDSLHRLTGSTNGAGATVAYSYRTPSGAQDLLDRVGRITYPGGVGSVVRGYDDAGRLTSVKDFSGATLSFGYDSDSNLTTSTVPSTATVTDTTGYNAADQATSITSSNGSTLFGASYHRDANGQLTSDSSAPPAVDAYRYTPLNQLCYAGSSSTSACSSPPGGSQPFSYDASDNLTTFGSTTQRFDAAGELCWTSPTPSANACSSTPAGGTAYSDDSRGNRISAVPASGPAACDRYDQENRLSGIVTGTGAACASPSAVATYSYDGDGLRQSKTVGGSTTHFTWDTKGTLPLLLQEVTGGVTTSYIDGPGGMLAEQVTSSRPAISMVGSPVTAADSSGAGGSLILTLPSSLATGDDIIVGTTYQAGVNNSVATPAGYTAIASPVTSGGTAPTADVTEVFASTAAAGGTSVTLTYSGVFPKAAVAVVYRGTDPTMPIDVVATGATASGTSVATSATTRYPNDQLVLVQGASYLATSPGSWSAPAGGTEEAQKDATLVTIGVADTHQTPAGPTGSLASTFMTTGTFAVPPQLTAVLVALQTSPAVVFAHHDQLGSTRLLTDLTGAPRASFTVDPFGNLMATSGTVSTPFLYAGQYRDAESGLDYMRARYYDPSTAQFLSRDPLEMKTRARFGYVGGNPLNATDPAGLDSQPSQPQPEPTSESPDYYYTSPTDGGCQWSPNLAHVNLSSDIGSFAARWGYTRRQVRDAIHTLKKGIEGNPDVELDPDTGDVYVREPGGDPELLGNIGDEIDAQSSSGRSANKSISLSNLPWWSIPIVIVLGGGAIIATDGAAAPALAGAF